MYGNFQNCFYIESFVLGSRLTNNFLLSGMSQILAERFPFKQSISKTNSGSYEDFIRNIRVIPSEPDID